MENSAPKEKTKPVFSRRYGKVKVAVWRAESKDGSKFFRTTFQCQYKNGKGEWLDCAYSAFDLLDLARATMDALSFIRTREQGLSAREAA